MFTLTVRNVDVGERFIFDTERHIDDENNVTIIEAITNTIAEGSDDPAVELSDEIVTNESDPVSDDIDDTDGSDDDDYRVDGEPDVVFEGNEDLFDQRPIYALGVTSRTGRAIRMPGKFLF